jgi:hypothetical protein
VSECRGKEQRVWNFIRKSGEGLINFEAEVGGSANYKKKRMTRAGKRAGKQRMREKDGERG